MPATRPFRAIRYAPAAVGDLSAVLAPPYDVISPADHKDLLARDSHNAVRLSLADDGDPPEWHAAAAARFAAWQDAGVLVRDELPAFYAYSQTFTRGFRTFTRTALLGMVRLSEFGRGEVRPHERTHSGPKLDRLKLLRATRANMSPIFALCPPAPDVQQILARLQSEPPLATGTDHAGVVHELRQTTNPREHAAIQAELDARSLYIADGHHRYETALSFRDESRAGGADAPTDYVLMALVAMDDLGLVILAAHRLVQLPAGLSTAQLLERLEQRFPVRKIPAPGGDLLTAVDALVRREPAHHQFGVYLGSEGWRTVRVPRAEHSPSALAGLDVVALHRDLLEPHVALDAAALDLAERIAYTQDPADAVRRVDSGEFGAAFFLRPVDVAEVRAVADAGECMPQKGTYFFPKLISGLVVADLRAW
ncbi:MAG: hypothetical protein AUJ96_12955 [Armatimonadetes bacterium CG2_30_66_41]|nr:DUF1015 domain-containing protein [Armatimonadota bacterium]NCQ30223.1 DUF1015 domain-containing protein [Armatimonadota bacterium]OIP04401.1 MAG: hypothetical protein AUJ96_12955 [Armatimonadetes bacterium CG2_30_66_41]